MMDSDLDDDEEEDPYEGKYGFLMEDMSLVEAITIGPGKQIHPGTCRRHGLVQQIPPLPHVEVDGLGAHHRKVDLLDVPGVHNHKGEPRRVSA